MSPEARIAISVNEAGKVWTEHFGIAPYFQIYEQSGKLLETRSNPLGCVAGFKNLIRLQFSDLCSHQLGEGITSMK